MSFFSQSLSVSVQSGPSQKFLKAKVRVLRVSGYRKLTLQRLKMRQNSMTENLEFASAEKLVSIAVAEKSSREVYVARGERSKFWKGSGSFRLFSTLILPLEIFD